MGREAVERALRLMNHWQRPSPRSAAAGAFQEVADRYLGQVPEDFAEWLPPSLLDVTRSDLEAMLTELDGPSHGFEVETLEDMVGGLLDACEAMLFGE